MPSDEGAQLEQSWRRIILGALPFSLIALVAGWFLERSPYGLTPYDHFTYPIFIAGLSLFWLCLWLFKNAFRWIILGIIGGTALFFISKLIYILFVLPPNFIQGKELSETFFWTPIIYLLSFFVIGVKTSKRIAIHFTLAYFWVGLIYTCLRFPSVEENTINTLNILVQTNLSHIVQLILSFSFITFKKHFSHSQNQLEALDQTAHTDPLTGLPNRLSFQKTLEKALQNAQKTGTRIAVFFIDLDRFKIVNDTLGHQAGDRLLELVSERLKNTLRQNDFVARISGDEFILMATNLEKTNLITLIAQRLMDIFTEPFEVFGQNLNISASVGISIFPDDAYEADLLLRHADSAMYNIKKKGKNGFMTYQETDSSLERRWQLEKDLSLALEQQQFKIYCQPLYNLHTGEMVKMEALVRWEHPDQGIISPTEFISIAEESGQILTLGSWVLDEACRQAKSWGVQDKVKISVNVSALQFAHPNFVITVMNALKESGLPGYSLELELTESIVIGHPEDVKRTLLELKDLGIQLAIDDFGTGYSSLAYLRDLPIDTIKIDKSFIQDLDVKVNNTLYSRALVETIINLAKSLDLEVVAEGVETEAQCVMLRKLGCHVGQGYHFSKPIPADKVESLVSKMLHRPTLMAFTAIEEPENVF